MRQNLWGSASIENCLVKQTKPKWRTSKIVIVVVVVVVEYRMNCAHIAQRTGRYHNNVPECQDLPVRALWHVKDHTQSRSHCHTANIDRRGVERSAHSTDLQCPHLQCPSSHDVMVLEERLEDTQVPRCCPRCYQARPCRSRRRYSSAGRHQTATRLTWSQEQESLHTRITHARILSVK